MLEFQKSEFYDKKWLGHDATSLLVLADKYWTENSKCAFSKSMLPAQLFAEKLMDVAKVFVPRYITHLRYSKSLQLQNAYYLHHDATDKAEALASLNKTYV